MSTTITIAICIAIAVYVAALIFVPGMNMSLFAGLAKGVATVWAANRKERVAARREYRLNGGGVFFRRKRKLEENVEEKVDPPENVTHTVDIEQVNETRRPLINRLRRRRERTPRRRP